MKLSSIVFLLLIVVSTIGITFPVSAEVVINEILYHAADSELEFIELYNPGGESIDLSRWSVKDDIDSHRFAFPSGTVISSEGYLVITNDAVQFRTAYSFDADLSGLPFNLSNAGDTVRLFDSSGTLVEWIRYDDRAPWPESADGSGISLERRHPLLPANESSAWAASTPNGTPGEQNSAYTEELEPLILDLDHNPKIPSPSEEVTVTARVLDADGNVDSVQLSYGYGDGLSYETIAMMDDGLHGDGEAGDGVYGASIPGSNNLTVIRFYIRAVDDEGLDASLPMEGPREPYLTVVESQGRAERVSFLRIVMTPENQAAFLQKYQTDEYTPATFYDGETVYYRVNIRHRGRSRSVNARFKILFPHHQLYRDKIRRLNLNGTDYSTLLKQYISYQLYGAAGLPNLETEIVRFHINGSAAQGIPYRCAIENPDRQFLRRKNFFSDDSGNLYKTTLDGTPENKATWRYIGDDPSLYERSYLKQTNEEEADWSDVVQFCKALSEPETWDDDYLEQVYSVLNTDEFLLWMAVSACVAHWDSPFTDHGQNYVLYNNPQTRQFHILAWDLNGTFNYTSNLDDLNYRKLYTHLRSTKFPAINKILNHPVFGAQYYRNVDGLLGTLFSKSSMDARIEEARSALQLSSYQTSFMQTYLIRRREDLAEWINREQGAAFLTKPVYQAIVGDPYMYHATAVDYRRASRVTYDLKQAPSWLTLDSNRGILQGIPPETGRFEIELAAQTGQGIELTQSFELHVVSPEPRLLMNMNETSGPALDVSVYGHEGQLAGDAQRVDGRLGQAVYLDGSRDYIRIPHSEDLNLTGEITVEAWIRPDSISNGNPVILTKGDADHFNYTLMLGYGPFSWDAMEPCFMPARFGIEHRVYYGRKEIEAQLRPRSWSHIAGTYNSTSELVCVYYNNYRIVESACRALMTENTNALLIGLNSSQCFRGAVDDVKILPFEKTAFAAGLCLSRVDVSGISAGQERVAISLSEHRPEPVLTEEYCLYLANMDRWIPLPPANLQPGESVEWWLDELGVNHPLSQNETLALYPLSSMGTPSRRTILDQVSWGEEAPGASSPGVQAGVWIPDRAVSLNTALPLTIALKAFGDNDEMDEDWETLPQMMDGPAINSFTINGGAEKTAERAVTVAIHAEGNPAEMRLSNDPDFEDNWIPYQERSSWELEPGDGLKTVYVQLRDGDQNRSAVMTQTILLETDTRVKEWRIE